MCNTAIMNAGKLRSSDPIHHLRLKTIRPGIVINSLNNNKHAADIPLGRTSKFHQKELKHEKHSASVMDVHKFSHHSVVLLSNYYPQPIILLLYSAINVQQLC